MPYYAENDPPLLQLAGLAAAYFRVSNELKQQKIQNQYAQTQQQALQAEWNIDPATGKPQPLIPAAGVAAASASAAPSKPPTPSSTAPAAAAGAAASLTSTPTTPQGWSDQANKWRENALRFPPGSKNYTEAMEQAHYADTQAESFTKTPIPYTMPNGQQVWLDPNQIATQTGDWARQFQRQGFEEGQQQRTFAQQEKLHREPTGSTIYSAGQTMGRQLQREQFDVQQQARTQAFDKFMVGYRDQYSGAWKVWEQSNKTAADAIRAKNTAQNETDNSITHAISSLSGVAATNASIAPNIADVSSLIGNMKPVLRNHPERADQYNQLVDQSAKWSPSEKAVLHDAINRLSRDGALVKQAESLKKGTPGGSDAGGNPPVPPSFQGP